MFSQVLGSQRRASLKIGRGGVFFVFITQKEGGKRNGKKEKIIQALGLILFVPTVQMNPLAADFELQLPFIFSIVAPRAART